MTDKSKDAKRQYKLKAEPGHLALVGSPASIVREAPPAGIEGHVVEYWPDSGGRSYSKTDHMGAFVAEFQERLVRGREGEPRVLKILTQALRAAGYQVSHLAGACDARGEDGRLSINGEPVPVQIVSLPSDPKIWKELSKEGSTSHEGTNEDAIRMVRRALEHKRHKAARTLLVLDAAHIGAIAGTKLVESYLAVHQNPEKEYSLFQVWIVGPTARSSFRLGCLRHPMPLAT